MHPLIARLDAALATNYPEFHAALGPGSPQEDLDELERTFGIPLPQLYRDFVAWHGPDPRNQYPRSAYMIKYYELTSARNATATLTMLRELRADEIGWIASAWWGEHYLPLMEHGGPELVIDMKGEARLEGDGTSPYPSIAGQVLEFHHADELRPVHAPSLEAWIEAVAISCERQVFGVEINDYGKGPVLYLTDEGDRFDSVLGELAPGFPADAVMLTMPDDYY
ncbi:SMI1/KNR4 family protein [Tsukamurella ocularis]|uniref:SMI1/KNR4 family protein n=1 Tax=Tsukamurella ocularis TaxID=1970234 RepID=UPI00216A5BD8|nr:SMI1/KNR4 family protein [Tsukamurella ocularis]MCS3782294.1 cell wall assembly regulator SMI1 [Tsukamurella ocularis]MCS3789546.1 cell wall assembly regulator SMI1 [Tsukamurella ocularis]MCS3852693.1 cell wall assembly regulator SMI1 [Tsukamurella ocularis]